MVEPPSQPSSDRPSQETLTDAAPGIDILGALPSVIDDRYVLGPSLGEGGMGTVVEAVDRRLGRTVAIKLLKRHTRPDVVERARREARAVAQLAHPNVIEVFDVGTYAGLPYIVMERIEGESLRDWQKRAPGPSWRQIVKAYIDVAEGLEAAHRAGIVHRDFKPANAMRDASGRVRVLDFGLAGVGVTTSDEGIPSSALGDETLTRPGFALGTPAYMAPEQQEGWPVDAAADIFALGVSLYEGLFGVRPYPPCPNAMLLELKREGPPHPEGPRSRDVPHRVWRVVERALAPNPDDRWPTAESMARALRSASHRVPPLAIGVAAVGLGVAGFVLAPTGQASECSSRPAEARRHWSETEPVVRSRLEGAKIPARARDDMLMRLEAFTTEWANAMASICEGDTVENDRARQCLSQKYDAWLGLTTLLRDGGDRQLRTLGRSRIPIERPQSCLDPSQTNLQPLPSNPADRAALEEAVAWADAYELVRQSGGDEDPDGLARALETAREVGHAPTIARLEHRAGLDALLNTRLEEAERAFERTVISAADGGDTRRLVFGSVLHAHTLARLKRHRDAERSRRRARAHWDALSANPIDVHEATLEDAATLLDLGRTEEALAMVEPLLDPSVYETLPFDTRASVHARVGSAKVTLDQPDAAAEHFAQQLDILQIWLKRRDPSLLAPMGNLAVAFHEAGRLDDAVETYDDLLAIVRVHLPPEHPNRIFYESNAGNALADVAARRAEAISLLERVVERAAQHSIPMVQAQSLLGLAKAHALAGHVPEAAAAYRRARVIAEAELGPEDPQTLYIVDELEALEATATDSAENFADAPG